MPLYGTGYIFSKSFFTGWVVVGIIWIFCSLLAVGVYPAWESRATALRVIRVIFTGKGASPHVVVGEPAIGEETSGTVTPEKRDMSVKDS